MPLLSIIFGIFALVWSARVFASKKRFAFAIMLLVFGVAFLWAGWELAHRNYDFSHTIMGAFFGVDFD